MVKKESITNKSSIHSYISISILFFPSNEFNNSIKKKNNFTGITYLTKLPKLAVVSPIKKAKVKANTKIESRKGSL